MNVDIEKTASALKGIIDLLELTEGDERGQGVRYAVVYDYKRSREKKFKLIKAYYGLDLQLLIYLLAAQELGPEALGELRRIADYIQKGQAPPAKAQSQPVPSTEVSSPSRAKSPGRNDPCPCGSGRKFKNCCARK